MARRSSAIPRTSSKKDKIIQLLKEGESSSVIIANKAWCNVAYVNTVKNELLRSQRV